MHACTFTNSLSLHLKTKVTVAATDTDTFGSQLLSKTFDFLFYVTGGFRNVLVSWAQLVLALSICLTPGCGSVVTPGNMVTKTQGN